MLSFVVFVQHKRLRQSQPHFQATCIDLSPFIEMMSHVKVFPEKLPRLSLRLLNSAYQGSAESCKALMKEPAGCW